MSNDKKTKAILVRVSEERHAEISAAARRRFPGRGAISSYIRELHERDQRIGEIVGLVVKTIAEHGSIAHSGHKQWLLDQALRRALPEGEYETCFGEGQGWDAGVTP